MRRPESCQVLLLATVRETNVNLSATDHSDQHECIAQQHDEELFLEYDESVTVANNQFVNESNNLVVGSMVTKSDKQSRRMSQLPIAWE